MTEHLGDNPHYFEANNPDIEPEAYATAQATLALALETRALRDEQRTANLIAWHGVIDSEDPVIEDLYSDIYTRLELVRKGR